MAVWKGVKGMRTRAWVGCLALGLSALLWSCAPRAETPEPEAAKVVQQYSIEDFYQNTEYGSASFSPDGRHVLVNSNQTGVFNLWTIPLDGGAPSQLTTSATDGMFSLGYFPADDRILFSRDSGGNELTHIYVRNSGGEVTDLTPGEKLKANFHGWSGDDRSFFISTNERDPQAFDIYEHATEGYARKLLYRNAAKYDLGPISRDKRWIALFKARTTNDSTIFLHDLRTKTTTPITPHSGDVNNIPTDFTPDSTKLLFVSDGGREFASLRSHDVATGAQAAVHEEPWDVLNGQYSKGGRYLVVSVNEDSRSALRILDARTLKPVLLESMPDGLFHLYTSPITLD
jgi:Tol biopolymer transport system component